MQFVRTHLVRHFVLAFWVFPEVAWAGDVEYAPPERVSVLPVFLVPQGTVPPKRQEAQLLMRHVEWAQQSYKAMLGERDTFQIAKKAPDVVLLKHRLEYYRSLPKGQPACDHVTSSPSCSPITASIGFAVLGYSAASS
jgi:hypothetical protein